MYQKERLDSILKILNEYNYVTVKYLVNTLHYSTATINRDLNILEKQKFIKRTYGGVELSKTKYIPLEFRYHKMKPEKKHIAREAAKLVSNGDTIFIDGTTTTQYMCEYLTNKKNVTVITNNIALVSDLSAHGVKVICLGGTVVEPPYILSGNSTVANAQGYRVDKMFFSTGGFDDSCRIYASDTFYSLLQTMLENSTTCYFLADHDKYNRQSQRILCTFADIDYVISDFKFDMSIQGKYGNTRFIEVKTE